MNDDMDMLPPDIKAMLRAEKLRVTAPDDGRRRLAERLSTVVPGFGPLLGPASAPPAAAPPLVASGSALKVAVAKAILAVAIGGGAVTAIVTRRPTLPNDQTHIRVAHIAGNTAGRVPSAPPSAADGAKTATSQIAPGLAPIAPRVDPPRGAGGEAASGVAASYSPARVASSPVLGPPSRLQPDATLIEERRLLDTARDAIVRGEPEAALGPTETHAARFPKGVLAEERDALRIRALARLGRKEEAGTLLLRMRSKYPRSFLLEGAVIDVDTIP